jgi:ligand-binding SRPBCC domain-containing protein
MPIIETQILVKAPIERVFDLNRSVDLHTDSTYETSERAVAGVTKGLLSMNDEVTWEATHFGVRQRLTSRIVQYARPRHFRDSMIRGAFRRFDHDHDFESLETGTMVRDRFDFDSPLSVLGRLANAVFLTSYMRRFLVLRLEVIKQVAESDDWKKYLGSA